MLLAVLLAATGAGGAGVDTAAPAIVERGAEMVVGREALLRNRKVRF